MDVTFLALFRPVSAATRCHEPLVLLAFHRDRSACHAEGRGFEPRRSRQISNT